MSRPWFRVDCDGADTSRLQIMDQVEGGTLIINKGEEEKAKENADDDPDARNLNYVEGLAEGWKLAEVGSRRAGFAFAC